MAAAIGLFDEISPAINVSVDRSSEGLKALMV